MEVGRLINTGVKCCSCGKEMVLPSENKLMAGIVTIAVNMQNILFQSMESKRVLICYKCVKEK